MDFMISLAHFCEVHGPTSILCTQVLPISCLTCFPPAETHSQHRGAHFDEAAHLPPSSSLNAAFASLDPSLQKERPFSAPTSRTPSFSRRTALGTSPQKSALNQHFQQQSRLQTQTSKNASASSSSISTPLDTPPTSPRSPTFSTAEAYLSDGLSSDACGGGKRYSGATSHGGGVIPTSTDVCANCSLSLPKSVSEQLPEGAPGSPTKDGKGKNGSPVLRTREAFIAGVESADKWDQDDSDHIRRSRARVRKHAYEDKYRKSTSKSPRVVPQQEDDDSPEPSDDDNALQSSTELDPSILGPHLSQTAASTAPSTSNSSTKSDRQSKPSGLHSHTLTYLTTRNPPSQTAYSLLRRSCIRTLSCELLPRAGSGPLVFGDPQAGYTIAYVFRIRDPRARGGRRGYALICLAGRDERRVMRAVPCVVRWFEGVAAWIVGMAEREANVAVQTPTSPVSISPTAATMMMQHQPQSSGVSSVNITPVSSFLSGRSHDPDGFLRRGATETRAKGLAELVGREDFFVEVHAVFVKLLSQLGRMLPGGLEGIGEPIDSGIRGEVGELEKGVAEMVISKQKHRSRRGTNSNTATASTTSTKVAKEPASSSRHLETGRRQELVA